MTETSTGCSLCRGKPAAQRGMELSLRSQRQGRLVVRECDGLIPVCDDCLRRLVVEQPRSPWPLLALLAGGLLLLRGNWLLGLAALVAGKLGVAAALRRPGQGLLQRRLRSEALVFSSVPLTGFAETDVWEVVLERRISVRYNEDGSIEAGKADV